MDEKINELISITLNVHDRGTYYSSDNRTQTFTKNDMEKLIRSIELKIAKELLEICSETHLHFKELDETAPEYLRSSASKAIQRISNKLSQKLNIKKTKAI